MNTIVTKDKAAPLQIHLKSRLTVRVSQPLDSLQQAYFFHTMSTLEHQDTFGSGQGEPPAVSFDNIVPRRRRSIGSVDSIIDEENINWWVLFTRVFLIILVCLIVVTLGLYEMNPSIIFLSVFLCAFLILCLVATFFDISCLWKCLKKKEDQLPPTENADSSASPPQPTDVESPISHNNNFGDYHNRL